MFFLSIKCIDSLLSTLYLEVIGASATPPHLDIPAGPLHILSASCCLLTLVGRFPISARLALECPLWVPAGLPNLKTITV